MRKLFVLRGAMASGKSTFIKNNNLEGYTLSADKIRLLFNSPEMTTSYTEMIPQFNNMKVWNLLFQILEDRMRKGELTFIDATHVCVDDLSAYKKLAEKYRYRLYVIDFTDVELDELISRNKGREELKQVPEESIRKAYKILKKDDVPK
jgi:predicted kinase